MTYLVGRLVQVCYKTFIFICAAMKKLIQNINFRSVTKRQKLQVPVVVYWPPTRPNMPFQRRLKFYIPLAWASLADNMGQGWNPTVQSQTDSPEEWPVNCMTVISTRWRSNMPFQRRRRCIFWWPVMGGDWVGGELLYNRVHRKFNQFGDKMW